MKKTVYLLSLVMLSSLFAIQSGAQPDMSLMPRLEGTSSGEKPVTLDELSIEIDIVGGIAVTRYDMLFHNPNGRDLEGELTFPLAASEIVTGYALEVNGKMRDGVVVDKAKGRQVFEEIVNRQVDPGLLEKTEGNSYKTRIYPVPANGYKRVSIVTQQQLRQDGQSVTYVLPMTSTERLARFDLKARVIQGDARPTVVSSSLSNFRFKRAQDIYEATFSARNHRLSAPLIFNMPVRQAYCYTENHENTVWFYAAVPQPPVMPVVTGSVSERITVWWDVSLSGLERDTEKEIAVLENYLSGVEDYRLDIVTFGDEIYERKNFRKSEGVSSVRSYLENLVYDGATDLTVLTAEHRGDADKIFLFSDGKSSMKQEVSAIDGAVPVFALASGRDNDHASLRILSRGQVIDLSIVTREEALARLNMTAVRLLDIKCVSGRVGDVYPKPGSTSAGDLALTGKLLSGEAVLEVVWGIGNRPVKTDRVTLDNRHELSGYGIGKAGVIPRLWAQNSIADLSVDTKKNRERIVELGVRYGVVTDYTSLIVLEDISDYIMYDIVPPEDLRDELYHRLLDEKRGRETAKKASREEEIENLIEIDYGRYYKPLIEWWETDFEPFDPAKYARQKAEQAKIAEGAGYIVSDDVVVASELSFSDFSEEAIVLAPVERMEESMADESVPFMIVETEADLMRRNRTSSARSERRVQNTIRLESWKPDAPYMDRLGEADDRELYNVYLEDRLENMGTPAYFVDVADEFMRRGNKAAARRVLSNILEISQENIELVKTYGQKLIEYGFYAEAVPVFEYGLRIREEHPQSYRDLALAHEYSGNYQQALDCFLQVLTKQWTRFDEIKPVVFSEMNSLISRFGKRLDLSQVPEELIFAMPVNTRITISWGTDNCDIDLHVMEPSRENCYYGRNRTRHGGNMSSDFTDGFGPEAYMIKRKNPGVFDISVNYFGSRSQQQLMPVTVYTDVFTGYGTSEQKRERITIRLTERKEKFKIGEIEVK